MLEFLIVYAWLIISAMLITCIVAWITHIFKATPPERRWKKVFQWLLTAVLNAERLFGPGAGPYKLHFVYTEFKEAFPIQSFLMRYSTFCTLVNIAVEQMQIFFDQ